MIRIAPPQAWHVSMSIPKTRFSRRDQVIEARVIRASALGERQVGEWSGWSAGSWPGAAIRRVARKRSPSISAFIERQLSGTHRFRQPPANCGPSASEQRAESNPT